ncbi:hypothetical protein V3W47_15045 [Deinococcus sp. YIM 134068]
MPVAAFTTARAAARCVLVRLLRAMPLRVTELTGRLDHVVEFDSVRVSTTLDCWVLERVARKALAAVTTSLVVPVLIASPPVLVPSSVSSVVVVVPHAPSNRARLRGQVIAYLLQTDTPPRLDALSMAFLERTARATLLTALGSG